MKKNIKNKRIILSIVLICVVMTGYVGRLVQVQLVNHEEYVKKASNVNATNTVAEAARGDILDRNGQPLVTNRMGNSVVFSYGFPNGKNDNQQCNDIILSLINLLESHGEEWIDNIPLNVDASGNASFPENRDSEVGYLKSRDVLHLNSYATAQDCFNALIEKFELQSYSKTDARKIASVRYEMIRTMFSRNNPYTFAEDVSTETVSRIKENSTFYKGVDIDVVPYRKYIDGTIAPHILGNVGPISSEEYKELKSEGYKMTDEIGKSGIEAAFEKYLRGEKGIKRTTIDDDGNVTSTYVQNPVQGNTVITTIDSPLQKVANEALAKQVENLRSKDKVGWPYAGALAVIKVDTGEVLACSTYPSYDASTYRQDYAKLVNDKLSPLWNRALMSTYAPGSIMKPGVAVTALETGTITGTSTYNCTRLYHRLNDKMQCLKHHGNINVVKAIKESCNIFFYEAGIYTGIEKMVEYSEKFGLGQETGLEIPNKKGILATPEYIESVGQTWQIGLVAQYAIGQSAHQFTPLQLANYVATIANGGKRYETHIIRSVKTSDYSKTVLEQSPKVVVDLELDPQKLAYVKEGMRQVGAPGGFCGNSFKVLENGITAAAKTGTPQTYHEVNGKRIKGNNATLITYAPADNPEIAIALVIEGGTTGVQAAPIAAEIYNRYFSESGKADKPQAANTLLK